VNGQPRGDTPIVADLDRKDQHRIRIELEGYPPYEVGRSLDLVQDRRAGMGRQEAPWIGGREVPYVQGFEGHIVVLREAASAEGGLARLARTGDGHDGHPAGGLAQARLESSWDHARIANSIYNLCNRSALPAAHPHPTLSHPPATVRASRPPDEPAPPHPASVHRANDSFPFSATKLGHFLAFDPLTRLSGIETPGGPEPPARDGPQAEAPRRRVLEARSEAGADLRIDLSPGLSSVPMSTTAERRLGPRARKPIADPPDRTPRHPFEGSTPWP